MQCPSVKVKNREFSTAVSMAQKYNGQDWIAAAGDYSSILSVYSPLVAAGLALPAANYNGIMCSRDTDSVTGDMVSKNGKTRFSDIKDGTSHTLLLVECAGRPDYYRSGNKLIASASDPATWPKARIYSGAWDDYDNSFQMNGSSYDGVIDTDLGPCAINCSNYQEAFAFHVGGANSVFADGSVHFLAARIDIRVFAAIITRAGEERIPDGEY
jgi:prepilin-type processing-associated H-X9-DG protein